MSANTVLRPPIALIALLLACSEQPTGIPSEPATDLEFTFVRLDPDRLVDFEHVVQRAPTDAPMPSDDWWGDALPSSTSIIDPRTRVGIYDYGASAIGWNKYTGNVGRVETTLEVAYKGQHLGTRTGIRQISTPFILDFGRVKDILVQVRLYTDKGCGLEAHAHSKHNAHWEFFDGSGAGSWGGSMKTSFAEPARGTRCGERVDDEDPTGRYSSGGGLVCTYLITYDLETGQVYDVKLLSCSRGGTLL